MPEFEEINWGHEELKDINNKMEQNWQKLLAHDKECKEAGKLEGRYVRESFADGFAFYIITKELKKTVRIKVVSGIGDDWVIPYWGCEADIDKDYAVANIAWRDKMASFVPK